jgi:hypothetical protein
MMGKRSGRLCFLYQLELGDDKLTYTCKSPESTLQGEVETFEDFQDSISLILELYNTDRIEVALKQFRLVGTSFRGICPKSLPRLPLTSYLLDMIYTCVGGENGTDLINLPFEGTILDQPNLFIQAYNIYVNEQSRWLREKTSKNREQEKPRGFDR